MEPKLIGYVVHLPDSDEFLESKKDVGPGAEIRGWSKTPGSALTFKSRKKAQAEVDQYDKGAVVAELYDAGEQYLVAIPE